MIKCAVLLLLLASAGYAEDIYDIGPNLPSSNEGEGSNNDLLLILLTQIKDDMTEMKSDISEVKADVSELKEGQSSLETTFGGLVIKVSSLETRTNDLSTCCATTTTQPPTTTTVGTTTSTAIPSTTSPPCTYRYETTPTDDYTWDDARAYCQSLGGDLAYHGFESMDYRSEVICNALNLCDGGYLWWGLKKVTGSVSSWQYVDGTPAADEDIHWAYSSDASYNGWDCSPIYSYLSSPNHLEATSYLCSNTYYGICEFLEFLEC